MNGTMDRLLDIAALPSVALPGSSRQLAALSLFDWLGVMLAGASEPLSGIIRGYVVAEAGAEKASIAGAARRVPARAAALANGTISHALDYDDTHFAHIGHLSVGIYPAALAVAEEVSASGADMRDAFLLGAEAACRIGMVLGRGHYQRGFHQTATAGAFGATIAAGRLYGLTRAQMRHALSLVSTRASGLKSQFGTMGKPFNAGLAASNGVEAAALAGRGFTSADDGIAGQQGFIETHTDQPEPASAWHDPPPDRFVFDDIKYKLHACCHGTHAMIEALQAARRRHDLAPAAVRRLIIRTHPRWLKVCDIKEPRSGLEVKFSYVHLAAMVISGLNTASEKTYTDALGADEGLKLLARRVTVVGNESLSDMVAEIEIERDAGETLAFAHDLAAPIPPADLERGLRDKSEGLLGAGSAERLWRHVADLERLRAGAFGDLIRT